MREKDIEQQLRLQVIKCGGLCEKWNAGTSGWPDRIILLPDGKIGFVELKAPGRKARVLQEHRHKQIRELGFPVFLLDSTEQIGGVIHEIQTA